MLSLRCAVVGRGRVGRALTTALPQLAGPFGRGFDGNDARGLPFDAVLLAVPDGQIRAAAAAIRPGPILGHCAGSLGLAELAPREAFAFHPLMTIPATGATFAGAAAAVAGTTPRALALARAMADDLGMHAVEIADADRGAYHAAASIASNFLVTLEDAAAQLLATTGAPRQILHPLAAAALRNWAMHGGRQALTGPIVRGDEATVARQRAAVAERTPHLLALFDEMCAATRVLAGRPAVDHDTAPGAGPPGPLG